MKKTVICAVSMSPALAYNMPKAYMKKASLSPEAMSKPEMKKA